MPLACSITFHWHRAATCLLPSYSCSHKQPSFHQLPSVLILLTIFINMLFNPRHLKPRLTSLLLAFAQIDIHNCFQVTCIQLAQEFCAAVIRLWKQGLRIRRPFSSQRHLCYTLSKHTDGTKSGTAARAISLQNHHQIKQLYFVSLGGLDTTGKGRSLFILLSLLRTQANIC